MAVEHFRLIVIYSFISQVIATYAPYIQYAGTPYPIPAYVTSYPIQSYAPSPAPAFTQPAANYQAATNYQAVPNYQPPSNIPYKTPAKPAGSPAGYAQTSPSLSPANVPVPTSPATPPIYQPTAYQATAHQQPIKATSVTPSAPELPKLDPIKPVPYVPKESSTNTKPSLPKDLLSGASPPFDSNVLNNLAIALQLLIVSNLIHNPPLEPNPAPQVIDDDLFPAIAPLPIAYIPPSVPEPMTYSNQYIPNANFIGTSSFGDTGISKSMMTAYGSPTLPAPRPMGLMSPYDAIGPNSPYADSFHSKSERNSPYHLSSDYKDLFSLTELFKI